MVKETNLNWNIKLIDNIPITKDFKLPNNSDCFELTDLTNTDKSSNKMKFIVSSMKQYYRYVEQCALQYQRIKILQNNGKIKSMTDLDVYNILKQYKLLSVYVEYDNSHKESQLYFMIKDYNDLINMYKEAPIDTILNKIVQTLNISNFTHLKNSVISKLYSTDIEDSEFNVLNIAPKHIVLTPNGILNSKTFEFTIDPKNFGDHQFISKLPFNVYHINDINPVKFEIVKRVFNDWADSDENKIKYLKQLCIAAIDGDGRKKLNILIGSGGNGKSAFINILKKLATDYTVEFNLQDISKDSKVNKIQPNTKLIAGDELTSNIKLVGETLTRIKSIITGGSILIDVKFKDAKNISYKGLLVQASNTLPKVFETTNALNRRFNVLEWTNRDFSKIDVGFNLDDLIEHDDEFMEAIIAYMFTNIEPFTNFQYVDGMREIAENLSRDADQVYQFLLCLKEQELLVGKIPLNFMYQMYEIWNKDENGNIRPLKSREFMSRLKNHLSTFGLKLSDKQIRISQLKSTDFNWKLMKEYYTSAYIAVNTKNMTRYVECKDQIDDLDITDMQVKLMDDELTKEEVDNYKQRLILEHLVQLKDMDAIKFMSLYFIENDYT